MIFRIRHSNPPHGLIASILKIRSILSVGFPVSIQVTAVRFSPSLSAPEYSAL
jgi:hypothetical protein